MEGAGPRRHPAGVADAPILQACHRTPTTCRPGGRRQRRKGPRCANRTPSFRRSVGSSHGNGEVGFIVRLGNPMPRTVVTQVARRLAAVR